jgi:hypothetical protein
MSDVIVTLSGRTETEQKHKLVSRNKRESRPVSRNINKNRNVRAETETETGLLGLAHYTMAGQYHRKMSTTRK